MRRGDFASEERPRRGAEAPPARGTTNAIVSLLAYAVVFMALYIMLAKELIAPYLLIVPGGGALTFGDSALPCWGGFSLAAVAGFRWARRGVIWQAIAAAVVAAVCAGGFCTLGYALLAGAGTGPALALLAAGAFAAARLIAGRDTLTSLSLAAFAPALVSLALFAGMTSGAVPVRAVPEVEGAPDWGRLREAAEERLEGLGIEGVELRVGVLPSRAPAEYSHDDGVITVSVAALLTVPDPEQPEDADDAAVGVLHAVAHCTQALRPDRWPGLDAAQIEAWLAATGGACPPRDDESFGAETRAAFDAIEDAADYYAQSHAAQLAAA